MNGRLSVAAGALLLALLHADAATHAQAVDSHGLGGAQISTPINTSLATVPVGYFGGNAARRGGANIAMLAKMRLVMLEKWEGPCWQSCLAQGPGGASCQPSCDVEAHITDTLRRVKALNAGVSGVLYLNTLMAFPFYAMVAKFKVRARAAPRHRACVYVHMGVM